MSNKDGEVSRYGATKFGSNARPKIVQHYGGAGGWVPTSDGAVLTVETAKLLRADGITMVRVRHHMKTVDVSLRRYLGG